MRTFKLFILFSIFIASQSYSRDIPVYIIQQDSTGSAFSEIIKKFNSGKDSLAKGHRKTLPGTTSWVRAELKEFDNSLIFIGGYVDECCLFYLDTAGKEIEQCTGFSQPIWKRQYLSERLYFDTPPATKDGFIYVRLRADFMIGIQVHPETFSDIINEHDPNMYGFMIFIGMAMIICIYNLILFFSLSEKIYLFYSMYLFAFASFASMFSGAGTFLLYKVTWSFGYFTLFFGLMTISLLLYTKYFLKGFVNVPYFGRTINILVIIRIILFIAGELTGSIVFRTQMNDYIMLAYPFFVGLLSYIGGNRSSIYFFLGFTTIFAGYFFHSFFMNFSNAIFYFGVVEIILFSVSISERFRIMKSEKEKEQLKTITLQQEMLERSKENEILKNQLNRNLEKLVDERTIDLKKANETLNKQAEEIRQMNEELMKYNEELVHEMEIISKARILEKNVDYESFSQLFPDDITCLGFIAELKWNKSFVCRKCGNTKSFEVNAVPYARRCANCAYQESATAFTVLDNVKFSIQKALYIVYITFGNPLINMNQLAKQLELRPATCFNFSKKVIEKADKFRSKRKKDNEWVNFLLFNPN